MPPLQVLLIEDSPVDSELILRALRSGGYTPVSVRVETEKDYVASLDNPAIDLVLADYNLPQFDAMRALALYQERQIDIPFIVVSGTIGDERSVEILKAGAHNYVLKDKLDRLVPVIERELRDAETRRERKHALEALAQSRDFYLTLFEGFPAMIWRAGVDGQCDYFNATWLAFRGRALSDELSDQWIDGMHPEDRERRQAAYWQAFAACQPFDLDYRLRRSDGDYRWIQDAGRPFKGLDGAFAGYIGCCTDVTDRRNAEEQLRHAMRMESIGRLAGGVAHDVNNILTGIGGLAQLLRQGKVVDAAQTEDLDEICSLVDRGAGLTRQLLTFSRRQPLQTAVLDMGALLQETCRLLQRLIGEHITLVCDRGGDDLLVEADKGQIEQVLMNLAINAHDAMPGGGTLTIAAKGVELDRAFADAHPGASPGAQVRLTVTDSGCGMSAETQRHIFEPFFTTKDVGKGTGLGLSTVYGIVKQHGGSIWVSSAPNQGTTFTIYLPRVVGDAQEDADGMVDSAASPGQGTVLLVEDEKTVRVLAQRILERRGHTVLAAATPEEARALFARHGDGVDVLLTDVIMPGTSGPDLADELSRDNPSLGVVFMSGYIKEMFDRLTPLHVTFVAKPFMPGALLAAVDAVRRKCSGGETTDEPLFKLPG